MKKYLIMLLSLILLFACFQQPDISAPVFTSKSRPDSLVEKGIDAGIDNSIYLEWEEPQTANEEGIVGYYLYRGVIKNDDYAFNKIASIERENGIIFKSDEYTDHEVERDTMYYYFLRSYNDFTISEGTSDTVQYKLTTPPNLRDPAGDIYDSIPSFKFVVRKFGVDNITHFYLRLFFLEQDGYQAVFFSKLRVSDLSQTEFNIYLRSSTQYTTILFDELWENEGKKYLQKGKYRWKIDAISSRLGGEPEFEGSVSDWMEFTVK